MTERLLRFVDAAAAALLLVALALSFSGWALSGTRSRSSYALVRSARSLDIVEGAWATVAGVWFALPLIVAVGVVAAGYRRRAVLSAVCVVVGLLVVGAWWLVKVSPLRVDTGAATSAVVGGCLIVIPLAFLAVRARPVKR